MSLQTRLPARIAILAALALATLAPLPQARAADDTAEIALQRKLDQPFNLTMDKVELAEAFKQIAAAAKISIQVDPACYELLPYGATTRVSADFRQSKLRDSIEEVLIPLALQQAVSGSTVMIRPSDPLAHIGRRAHWEELTLLQSLRTNDLKPLADGAFDWKAAIRTALDRQDIVTTIADEGVPAATRDKALDEVRKQLPMSVFSALNMYCQLTGQIWFVETSPAGATIPGQAGGNIEVMSQKAWIHRQLNRPIHVDFTNAPLAEVLAELSHQSGIRFVPAPGLYQMVPAVGLKSNNATVLQTLEELAGSTRIAFEIRDDSILLHMAGNAPDTAPATDRADTIVGRISVPVGPDKTMLDVFLRESDLPPDVDELRKQKIQQAIDGMRAAWEKAEPPKPAATEPSPTPATRPAHK